MRGVLVAAPTRSAVWPRASDDPCLDGRAADGDDDWRVMSAQATVGTHCL